jgi:hypothetical protein
MFQKGNCCELFVISRLAMKLVTLRTWSLRSF